MSNPCVIKVRVSDDMTSISPATSSASPSAVPVQFGGSLRGLRSDIRMVLSRDLLFFDQQLPLGVVWSSLSDNQSVTMSPVPQVAIRLSQFRSLVLIRVLWFAIDQEFLSHLLLVCDSSGSNSQLAEVASSPDRWGFRAVPPQEVMAKEPKAYRAGEKIVAQFREGIPGLSYEYVVE